MGKRILNSIREPLEMDIDQDVAQVEYHDVEILFHGLILERQTAVFDGRRLLPGVD